MIDYYGAFKTTIGCGGYVLADIEDRIDRIWLEGKLTGEQRDELRTMAAEHASDADQMDVAALIADLQGRVYKLEHPTDIYPVWAPGYVTRQHEIVRYDVTGDGELDLCRYDGGRSETSLSIGKIEGWHMLDLELHDVATITRGADGGYVVTPINGEDA